MELTTKKEVHTKVEELVNHLFDNKEIANLNFERELSNIDILLFNGLEVRINISQYPEYKT